MARHTNRVSAVATKLLQYCYIKGTIRLILFTLGGDRAYIAAYYGSDWAEDRATRKSTGAYLIFLGIGPVEWASKIQRLPAQYSAEAEFIAANAPAKSIKNVNTLAVERKWYRGFVFEI